MAPQAEFEPACAPSYGVSMAHIARLTAAQDLDLCVQNPITDPDVSVTVVGGQQNTALNPGADGFLYLGPTDTCTTGLIRVNASTVQGDNTSLDLRYCTR